MEKIFRLLIPNREEVTKIKYNCMIVNIDDEEITIKIVDTILIGFSNTGIVYKEGDKTTVDIMLFDDLEICESTTAVSSVAKKGNSLSYSLYGILDINNTILKSEIDFSIDAEELFDYGYLDGKSVRIDVVRIDFDFD